MKEILHFKVYRADARINENRGITIRLFYPRNPELITKRIKENLSFGIEAFERLIKERYSKIADNQNPIKPAAAGSLYLLEDGAIIFNRRDKFAPTHKLYHSAYAGFTQSRKGIYSAEGLTETALRETAEECLLITTERIPRLLVPNNAKEETIKSAKRLGLNLEFLCFDTEVVEPQDTLEVYYENGKIIFFAKGFLDLIYESQTSLNLLQIRKIPFSSQEVLPIDAEWTSKDNEFVHLNRESYMVNIAELAGKNFGSILENPRVYQIKNKNGTPKVFKPQYNPPYYGPDGIEVKYPHVFAPDNLLTRCLDALGVEGYKGRWKEIELWKEKKKSDGKSLVPESVLV